VVVELFVLFGDIFAFIFFETQNSIRELLVVLVIGLFLEILFGVAAEQLGVFLEDQQGVVGAYILKAAGEHVDEICSAL